jgi:hypothetical protein
MTTIDVHRTLTALDLVQFLDEHARRQGVGLDQVEIVGLEIVDRPRQPTPPGGTPYIEVWDARLHLRVNCPPDCIAGWDW